MTHLQGFLCWVFCFCNNRETSDSLTGRGVINALVASIMDMLVTSSQPEDTVFIELSSLGQSNTVPNGMALTEITSDNNYKQIQLHISYIANVFHIRLTVPYQSNCHLERRHRYDGWSVSEVIISNFKNKW